MNIWQVIEDLKGMPEPNRRADKTIAALIGLKEKTVAGGQYWFLGEQAFRRVPAFTSSIDAALLAVAATGGSESGGVTIGQSPASAVLDDGEHCQGATPPIALCVALLTRLATKE
jgi:hypothetical protein